MVLAGIASDYNFERMVIGDVDGFGWRSGKLLADNGIASAVEDPKAGVIFPVNTDNKGIVGNGDFLPDMDDSGVVAWVPNVATAPYDWCELVGYPGSITGLGDNWDCRMNGEREKSFDNASINLMTGSSSASLYYSDAHATDSLVGVYRHYSVERI